MAKVKKTLWLFENRHLRFRSPNGDFKVKRIKNDTRFKPGDLLSISKVNALISGGWDVTIEEAK
jgi:hypothetical protein